MEGNSDTCYRSTYAQTNVTVSHIGQNIQEVFEETFMFYITIGFEIIVVEIVPPFQ